jgi:hypothetical protein
MDMARWWMNQSMRYDGHECRSKPPFSLLLVVII